ncbi:hypothetical protein K9U39_16220 [Rhodoblastus acidophilus]|uniref:Lipoprotein n=1 Tax=Candidatus Rhodoblastus alkanivorans TaxID=2954117 RepID=A0ABS9Z1T3_9HYPH|nr:hypothetical protein [Candidatus Rhodoblastus alkanivorans]MCI4679412.1 hypothetical protein [Candidatus Rhodoblastus alkanivorans]MCI4681420.1 hypothetical protein [Candidatus Rhodoblastus alkanivorans]MDI4642468.1 hypothetical protein [Rhodoblastus acidophilus]
MTCRSLIKTALLAAALSGALLLEGCGRRGPPVPVDSAAAQKTGEGANATAQPHQKLPTGLDPYSLKAGARKTPTPFDFLL